MRREEATDNALMIFMKSLFDRKVCLDTHAPLRSFHEGAGPTQM